MLFSKHLFFYCGKNTQILAFLNSAVHCHYLQTSYCTIELTDPIYVWVTIHQLRVYLKSKVCFLKILPIIFLSSLKVC